MKINEFVNKKMKDQQRNMSWLADKLDVSYPTLYSRFKADNLQSYDLVKAAKVLNFDLNELKDLI
ncbi:hypothetical protein [Priestia megaterium]|uniref:hypothetical protein n=1 Tax=Priestia megaterium TaxID=1404 RepID=UPI00287746FA|nr:hypothetical protein [Priestia megaterium]